MENIQYLYKQQSRTTIELTTIYKQYSEQSEKIVQSKGELFYRQTSGLPVKLAETTTFKSKPMIMDLNSWNLGVASSQFQGGSVLPCHAQSSFMPPDKSRHVFFWWTLSDSGGVTFPRQSSQPAKLLTWLLVCSDALPPCRSWWFTIGWLIWFNSFKVVFHRRRWWWQ